MTRKAARRILVNAISGNAQPRGPDNYLSSLLAELACQDPCRELIICHAPWQKAVASWSFGQNARLLPLDPPRDPIARVAWHAMRFPGIADRQRADVVFLPNIFVMPTLRTPCAMTVHDLAHFRFPEKFGALKGHMQRVQIRLAMRRPDALIAVSEYTKCEMVRLLGVAPDRVSVVPEGGPAPTERDASPPSPPMLLYVGKVERSKNVEGLVSAFLTSDRLAELGARLLIAGSIGNAEEDVRRLIEASPRGRIERLGFVEPDELRRLYRTCTAFVFPSLVEGFGLVLLEAMAHGAPVIAMRATAVPEVVGDAGLLVEPGDGVGLMQAMEQVVCDPKLQNDLRAKGYRRVGEFSWRRAAAETLAILDRCAR